MMSWRVKLHRRVEKSIPELPARVRDTLVALIRDIEAEGPVRGNWPNYSKLGNR